ncbi:MAG: hypothetical protein WBX11_01320 [Thiobacillaceae bacterium]
MQLQQFRHTQEQPIGGPAGRHGMATLINLNPVIKDWYLLALDWSDGTQAYYHLENAAPAAQTVTLDPGFKAGLMLTGGAEHHPCDLWGGRTLVEAAAKSTPYAPLCNARLYLHNQARGQRTYLEAMVEFLRGHVWGGERLINTAKETVFRNAGREEAVLGGRTKSLPETAFMPAPARLNPSDAERQISRGTLGIAVAGRDDAPLAVGQWMPTRDLEGAFLSVIAPEAVVPVILSHHRDRANSLDPEESSALVYLIAFDLGRFDLGFGVGTDNPGVDWSPRPPDAVRGKDLPGPDGIDTVKPLITTGMIPPPDRARAMAAFTGGFKRYHGAFMYGDLALRNHGSHYGFIQEGVVLSKLQPGLATLYVLRDGSVHMHAWTEQDNRRLAEVRYARQNGVPLVEWSAAAGEPVPGALVSRWGAGNWSGSPEESLRTVRAGVCLQRTPDTQFLIYGYFSNATPSAMARVFQAYGCHDAMQLDINAPILTYLAVYADGGPGPAIQYLVQAMSEADQKVRGRIVPRFLAVPDNRDFFYLTRHAGGPT